VKYNTGGGCPLSQRRALEAQRRDGTAWFNRVFAQKYDGRKPGQGQGKFFAGALVPAMAV
jgi:hypothetical protein